MTGGKAIGGHAEAVHGLGWLAVRAKVNACIASVRYFIDQLRQSTDHIVISIEFPVIIHVLAAELKKVRTL